MDVEAEVERALAEDPYYQKLLGVQRELERMQAVLADVHAEMGRMGHVESRAALRERLRSSVTPWHRFSWRPRTPPRLTARTWKSRL